MKRRLVRGIAVAMPMVAMLVLTPPVHAELHLSVTFVATATLTGPGLGLPCTTDAPGPGGTTVAAPDPAYLCAASLLGELITTSPLPGFPEGLLPNFHLHFAHNPHTFFLVGLGCTGAGASPLKLATGGVGACGLTGVTGFLDGHCGLTGGEATGVLTLTDVATATAQEFIFTLHFNGIGSVVVLTGHVFHLDTAQTGLLVGAATVVPPTPALTLGESCLNLTALTFLLAGGMAGYVRSL